MEAASAKARMPLVLKGSLIALCAYATITFGDSILKIVTQTHSLLFTATIIDFLQITLLLIIAPIFGGYKKLWRTRNLKLQLLRGVCMTIVYLSFIYAITNMEIARAYAFYLTQPFILCLFAHFITNEKIGRYRLLALVFGFIGVLIMLRPGFEGVSLPVLAALLCATLFAASNILIKIMHTDDHWMSFVFYALLIQAPTVFIFYFLSTPEPFTEFRIDTVPFMATTALAYITCTALFAMSLRLIDASLFGGLEYTTLAWATLFGFFLFSEVPDHWTIAGAGVIVASGLYLLYREKKAQHRIIEIEGN